MYQTGASVSLYLKIYRDKWQSLNKSLGKPAHYPDKTLETTWLVSYERMQRQSPATINLLKFWACVDNRNLEYDLFQDSKGYFKAPRPISGIVEDRLQFLNAMGCLMENSFAQSTGKDQWALHRVLHRWISLKLKEATDRSILQWSVICLGSKAEKRGVSGYWASSGRLYTHAMRCIESIEIEHSNRQDSQEKWFDNLLGLARLCIARKVSLDKARKVLAFVITHDKHCLKLSEIPTPVAKSKVSLRAMNALGNAYQDENSYAEAAKIYQRLIEVLDSLDNARRSWLQNTCENYLTVRTIGRLQDSWPQISRLRPETRNLLELTQKIECAVTVFQQERIDEATKLFDALRLQLGLKPNNRQSIKVWKMAATCYAQRRDYGKARDIFEQVLPVSVDARGGQTNSTTLDILNNYGVVCSKVGDFGRAEELLGTAKELLTARKGMSDGLYLNTAENLGNLLFEMRSYVKAKAIFEECLIEAAEYFPQRIPPIRNQLHRIEQYQAQFLKDQSIL